MSIRKLISYSILLLFVNISFAQKRDTIYANASLEKATVYYGYGADLFHTTKVNLIRGMQQIIISNVTFQPDINTLQIACPENVTIMSYIHRIYTKPVNPIVNPLINKWNDSIHLIQKQINAINNDIIINDELLRRIAGMIENNFTTPDKKNIVSDELIKLTNYYSDKVSLLKKQNFDYNDKKSNLMGKINDINNRINELNEKDQGTEDQKPVGQFIIQVLAKEAGVANIDFNYFTRTAGWAPTYDIRVKTIDNSMKLVYKALVNNNTGLPWSGVKLNLSTSNPNQGTTLPNLTPTYLQLYFPQVYQADLKQEVTIAAAPQIEEKDLDEVVVTGLADKRKKSIGYSLTNVSANAINNVQDFTTLSENQLNTNYEIDLPYDIPSDGQPYSVTIKEEKVNTVFQHIAIPKLDNDAFLVAKLTRWDSLSLLPGQANVIMDNVYLGKTYLNPNITQDTLQLSLGRDKRVAIDRKMIKDIKSPKKSDTKTETYTCEITIRNNKKQSIELNLKDLRPISRVKEVEVIVLEKEEAEEEEETGILSWKIKLEAGTTKKVKFVYQIKYPKDKTLQEYK